MTTLRPGDRVQWWETFKNTKHEPCMMTGTVRSFSGTWVGIIGDGEGWLGGTWVRDADKLTLITGDIDTPVVPASSLEALTDDYDEMLRWSGSLGTVEL